MSAVRVKAYAKINLTLDVTGTADGYHLLDSLVSSVDLFDLVKLEKRKDDKIAVRMRGLNSEAIPPEENNAVKAAERFIRKFQTPGANISIDKNIPLGAGLGGSSADAAGVLKGLSELYGIDDPAGLSELADSLGSDVKFMMTGGFCRMRGRGTELAFLPKMPRLWLLSVCPDSSVSTPACYREYDRDPVVLSATPRFLDAFFKGDLPAAGKAMSNALYPAAARLNGDVERVYETLKSLSPLGVSMTGSGSAVLALFGTRELCEWAKSRYKGEGKACIIHTL